MVDIVFVGIIVSWLLLLLGALTILYGLFFFVRRAFRVSLVWGLMVLLIPGAWFVFRIRQWDGSFYFLLAFPVGAIALALGLMARDEHIWVRMVSVTGLIVILLGAMVFWFGVYRYFEDVFGISRLWGVLGICAIFIPVIFVLLLIYHWRTVWQSLVTVLVGGFVICIGLVAMQASGRAIEIHGDHNKQLMTMNSANRQSIIFRFKVWGLPSKNHRDILNGKKEGRCENQKPVDRSPSPAPAAGSG